MQNTRPTALPNLLLARSALVERRSSVHRMERHLYSSQTFLPMQEARTVLGVALDDGHGAPDLATFACFLAENQGFSYNAGVWHLPLGTLDAPRAFAVLMFCDGTPDDTHWATVPPFQLR